MAKDFYLDDHAAAAYFEKDWFDHVVGTPAARPNRFAFAPFALDQLYSDYHERFSELISTSARGAAVAPLRLLEIGSSTGRTFFELRRRFSTLTAATLVEPSTKLRDIHDAIFAGTTDAAYFSVLKGNGDLTEVRMSTAAIRQACAGLDVRSLDVPFADLPPDLGTYDLVVCSNVVDQCHEPLRLIELLKRSTAPGGLLAISCTYQWQGKYRGLPGNPIRHLDELFELPEWTPAGEANVPFRVRVNERHWMTFCRTRACFDGHHCHVFRTAAAAKDLGLVVELPGPATCSEQCLGR